MSKYQFNLVTTIALILFGFSEIVLLYFTPRAETFQLLTLYFALVAAYLVMCNEVRNIRTAAFIGVLTRCVAWLAIPELSDDIYRFIWDGSVILDGFNPYLETPTEFFKTHVQPPYEGLYPQLNSPGYYSVYPSIIQVISAFGALAGSDPYLATLIIKLPILVAEIGIIWMLPRLLIQLNLNPKMSIWYFLNPLVIIETCGNAHFEGIMIFFIVFAVKMIVTKKYKYAGLALAFGVGTKLMPLILFPFLWKSIPKKYRWAFTWPFALACFILFMPLYSWNFIQNFLDSIDLYFRSFEFNASVYYVVREIGAWFLGYNGIAYFGPALSVIALLILFWKWLHQESGNLQKGMEATLLSLSVYYLFATTVHPWYITTILMLGVLSGRVFPVVWTIVAFLSYTAYHTESYTEYGWVIALEYAILLLFYLKPQWIRPLLSSTDQSNVL